MKPPRLFFVTGKGGTGKSTVAAALATAFAQRHPTTLVLLNQRARAVRVPDSGLGGPSASRRSPGNLEVIAVGGRAELERFVGRIVPVKAIARRMLNSRTFAYVTAALPGLEAFLALERLRHIGADASREEGFCVVDAPATGSALELLSVVEGVRGIAPVGTLNRLASGIEDFLGDAERFGAVLIATPEAAAVGEALDALAILRNRLRVSCAAAVVNALPTPLFTQQEVEQAANVSKRAAELARHRVQLAQLGTQAVQRLASAGVRVATLPTLFRPMIDGPALRMLGRRLWATLGTT